jgi:hemerythrin-like domain-containing protein
MVNHTFDITHATIFEGGKKMPKGRFSCGRSGEFRKWLALAVILFIFIALQGPGWSAPFAAEHAEEPESPQPSGGGAVIEVSPLEDLMREHGLLDRILLIYQEIYVRLDKEREFPPEVLNESAGIVRSFIEDYHEKLEEDYIFPRFEKAGRFTELVKVLREQHQAGRHLTEEITKRAREGALKDPRKRRELLTTINLFLRLYRPHKAREDTVLFPALHGLMSPAEYDKMGDIFEDKETALFGEKGFEKKVIRVSELEKKLGIYELERFAPK